ncbi:MAG: T9SS type A sorting domain-containing protein [Candidatus Latescibacterota bacterium]
MANKQPHRKAVPVIILSLLLIGAGQRAHAITEPRSPMAHFRSGGADSGGNTSQSTYVLRSFVGQSTPVGRSQSPTSLLCGGMGYILGGLNKDESPVVVNEETGSNLPPEFLLYQNSPNPFNPITEIRYQLPKASDVEIVVYSLRGQEVRRLVDGRVEGGYCSVVWDAMDAASGVYLVRMQAGDSVEVRKMVLIR